MHRILIIDDLQAIHDDFRKILAGSGTTTSELTNAKALLFGSDTTGFVKQASFELDHALQGADGLQRVLASVAEGRRYTMAFVDMRMPPGWNGLQTIQRLWEADADLQVVICTAYSDQSWDEIASTLGLTDRLLILKKPFDPVEVLQLATALSEKWVLKHQATLKFDELEKLVQLRTTQLAHDAMHDALTGLPNRAMLQDRLAKVIERCKADSADGYAVYFLDFDRFKVVNDSLGHSAGDELLVEIASRLTACAGSPEFSAQCNETLVARLGGDEFVVMLAGLRDSAGAFGLAHTILRHLSEPYLLKGYRLTSTASIGIATGDMGCGCPDDAIRNADIAMYQAKAAGKAQCVMFDRRMHDDAARRLTMENELRGVVDRGELFLHYQPVVDISSGVLMGFEALVRWNHPERGVVPPIDFIPCAEETGTIVPIGLWVLRTACEQLGQWRKRHGHMPQLNMSVNVSARQLMTPGFVEMVQSVLADTRIEARFLALEITETMVITDPEFVTTVLVRLKSLGVRLYMDDFGTGYTSLSYLHRLPIDALKMDRSFMAGVNERKEYTAIVHAIVTLARNLGIAVVAEGVETPEQVALLQAMECEYAQGYLFGRPSDPTHAEKLIAHTAFRAAA